MVDNNSFPYMGQLYITSREDVGHGYLGNILINIVIMRNPCIGIYALIYEEHILVGESLYQMLLHYLERAI
jgi:hypothetical protein